MQWVGSTLLGYSFGYESQAREVPWWARLSANVHLVILHVLRSVIIAPPRLPARLPANRQFVMVKLPYERKSQLDFN